MAIQVFQRPDWHGEAKQLGELFVVRKNDALVATWELWSDQFGFELRLVVGTGRELVRSQVCRADDEILTASEQWKAGLIEKRWE